MHATRSVKALAGIAALAFSAVALTACSSGPATGGAFSDMTLAQTKSPVQLLRNEAASRIPQDLITEVVAAKDSSQECPSADNPDGLIRSWGSSARVSLTDAAGLELDTIVDGVVQSFVAEGWEAGTYGVNTIIDLTSKNSVVAIHIRGVKGDEETGAGAKIQLSTGGPCVVTEGPDSAEVLQLENR